MPPITIALVTEAINEIILKKARHSAQADEARQCEEFCGQLAVDSEDRTVMFEDDFKKHELLFHHLAELYHHGRLQPWVIAALQLQVATSAPQRTRTSRTTRISWQWSAISTWRTLGRRISSMILKLGR